MDKDIQKYIDSQSTANKAICAKLSKEIMAGLSKADNKMWHGGPVWFIDGNPIVGYSVKKKGVQLLFWSGMSFKEPRFSPVGNVDKYKAAGVIFVDAKEVKIKDLKRWLRTSKKIQWDYKNIVKRGGVLIRLK